MKVDTPSLMIKIARFIEKNCDQNLTLDRLAKEALMSRAHFQKCFKHEVGVSPKEYQDACRLKKLRKNLRSEKTVTDAVYEAGHGSPSRIYEKLDEKVGMTPRQYQKSGKGLEISFALSKTTLGNMIIAATDRGVCFLQFGDSKKTLLEAIENEFPEARLIPMSKDNRSEFERWIKALNDFLEGESGKLDLPLDIRGTAFQIRVWKFLQKIPRGQTVSYTEIAETMGQPRAARAVASACAKNNIAIAIPCHRVLRGSGELAGYRWGIERKRALLNLENALKDRN